MLVLASRARPSTPPINVLSACPFDLRSDRGGLAPLHPPSTWRSTCPSPKAGAWMGPTPHALGAPVRPTFSAWQDSVSGCLSVRILPRHIATTRHITPHITTTGQRTRQDWVSPCHRDQDRCAHKVSSSTVSSSIPPTCSSCSLTQTSHILCAALPAGGLAGIPPPLPGWRAEVGESLPDPTTVGNALHALHLNTHARQFQTPLVSRAPSVAGEPPSDQFYPGLELQNVSPAPCRLADLHSLAPLGLT